MLAEATYIKPTLVRDEDGYWLECNCQGRMIPKKGVRLDLDEEAHYLWFVCSNDAGHITKAIEISEGGW